MYTYTNTTTGMHEDVAREAWGWEAHYADGSVLKQFDDDGVTFHRQGEMFAEGKEITALIMREEATGRAVHLVLNGAKPYHKYRHFIFAAGTAEERREKVYAFGKNGDHACEFYILENGDVILAGDEKGFVIV